MSQEDFQRVVDTFFGQSDEAAQSGPDLVALHRLDDDERALIEARFLAALGPDDARPAIGLGELRSQRAVPGLTQLLQASAGHEDEVTAEGPLSTAIALWQINRAPEALATVITILQRSPFTSIRVHAASALRDFRAPEAVDALKRTVTADETPVVRHNAAKSLLVMHGLLDDPKESPPVTLQIMNKKPAIRAQAERDLADLLRGRPLVPAP